MLYLPLASKYVRLTYQNNCLAGRLLLMQVKKDQIQKVNLGPWLQEVNDEIQNGNRVCACLKDWVWLIKHKHTAYISSLNVEAGLGLMSLSCVCARQAKGGNGNVM